MVHVPTYISAREIQHDAADKKHNKIQASYTLEGTVLENFESIKFLGATITSDLKWNSRIRNVIPCFLAPKM